MARRYGAPGAKTVRARRRCGSGLRAWRHLELNPVRLAPSRLNPVRLAPSQLNSVRLAPLLVCLHVGASSAKWRKVFIIK